MLLLLLLGEAAEEDSLGHLVVFSYYGSCTILSFHQLCEASSFSTLSPMFVLVLIMPSGRYTVTPHCGEKMGKWNVTLATKELFGQSASHRKPLSFKRISIYSNYKLLIFLFFSSKSCYLPTEVGEESQFRKHSLTR